MNLPRLAIDRPYAVAVFFVIAILLGLFALARLPIDLMPDITFPTLTVSTEYPGVGPEEIETLITRPVEEAVSATQGLEEVGSVSVEGRSQVRLSFRWGTDLDAAADDLRARLERIRNRLPDGATAPAVFKFDLAAFPVVFLTVSGQLDPLALRKLAEDQVKPRLERLPGVAAVEVRGGLEREIRIEVDRQKLEARGLGIDQVITALARENVNAAAGEFLQGDRELGLRVAGEFRSLAEIAEVPLTGGASGAARQGKTVRIRDVANVVDTHPDRRDSVTIDGRPGLQLAIRKQAGTNTVAVAEGIVGEVGVLNQELRGASVAVTNDTSRFIKRSIHHLGQDIFFGAGLAVVVLLFFLRDVRSTVIVTMAIPISVIATFGLLHTQGFSLNTMSLGGLALGVGRLVDDAIVVIENIYRHRAMGKPAAQAALDGTRQVSLAIVASTATTLAVFVPLIFLTGMTGVMFQQLSLVVVFSLTCSLIVAQGLVPMLAARFLGPDADSSEAPDSRRSSPGRWLYDAVGRILERLDAAYARSLRWALGHGKRVVTGAGLLTLFALAAVPWVGTEFMPATDEGEVKVALEMAVGTPLEVLEARVATVEAIVRDHVPETETLLAEIGGGGMRAGGGNTGSVRVILVEAARRKRSSEKIAIALRRQFTGLAGVTVRVSAGGGLRIMRLGQTDEGKLAVQIRGHDFATARRLAEAARQVMVATPGIADVRVNREAGRPEAVVHLDRARAADLGVSVTQVARALEAGVLGVRATMFREGGDEHAVVVRLAPGQRRTLDEVLNLSVTTASGRLVPVRGAITTVSGEGPARIDRDAQERVVTVSAELEGSDLGGVVATLREGLRQIPVPADFALVVTGDFEEQEKSFRELFTALALALLLVYLVMVAQFESPKHPFVILFSVPACILGVVSALLLTGTTLNVQSFIGIIVLAGVAVSNGIVLVDYMNQLRTQPDADLDRVVFEGARARLRPVLMTAAATVFAMTPMALGLGEGGELQAPMARVVIGGLLTSTAITLYLIPLLYRWFNSPRSSPKINT